MLTCVYCYRFNVIGCRLLAVLLNVFKPCVSSQEPQNGPDRFPGRLVKKNDLKQALVLLCLVLLTLVVVQVFQCFLHESSDWLARS